MPSDACLWASLILPIQKSLSTLMLLLDRLTGQYGELLWRLAAGQRFRSGFAGDTAEFRQSAMTGSLNLILRYCST